MNILSEAHYLSQHYWQYVIRHLAAQFFQCVGICKIGSLEDENAAVDPLFKVKEVLGLRVLASSIMPIIVSVNTNSANDDRRKMMCYR